MSGERAIDQGENVPRGVNSLVVVTRPKLAVYRARIGLASVVAILILQSVIVEKVGEPYPALLMPKFPGTGGAKVDSVTAIGMEIVFVDVAGQTEHLKLSELMAGIPVGHHAPIAWQFFAARLKSSNEELIRSKRVGRKYRLSPGLHLGRDCRDCEANLSSLQVWLRRRASEEFGDRRFSNVEFRWYRDDFTLTRTGLSAHFDRKPAGTFQLALTD